MSLRHVPRPLVGGGDAAAFAEGVRLERQRIYMALVDRLWGCDNDANAVLDLVENPEDDNLPEYADDEYNGRIPGR